MPEFGFAALAVLLVLLPGFLTARVVQSLCVRPSQTELDKIVEALLYSFLIYVVFAVLREPSPLRVIVTERADGAKVFSPQVDSVDLLFLLLLAFVLGLAVSASVTNDLHGRLFRRARLTQRTTRSSIWSDVFHELGNYVQVQFCDGRKIIGWPRYYADTPEEASLFLENAAWVDRDNKLVDIPGPGVLTTKNMPIESIMFLRGDPPAK
jgi:hypothetical protein